MNIYRTDAFSSRKAFSQIQELFAQTLGRFFFFLIILLLPSKNVSFKEAHQEREREREEYSENVLIFGRDDQ